MVIYTISIEIHARLIFRSDLTKVEREAAYTMEIGWANSGKGGQYDFNDAIFRNEKRYDPTQESVEKKNIQSAKGQRTITRFIL
ncbi:hypothetical protein BsIDN1_71250 [Bacillus safensis]|uniref:Uncharacterized protein n=1 Tax=Bacillus safensis TaxID=561879 RepID=A0A5S9MJA1_BACIA|nr:hypothetical protein BsIDN1_71250 [Bacillus safensis]